MAPEAASRFGGAWGRGPGVSFARLTAAVIPRGWSFPGPLKRITCQSHVSSDFPLQTLEGFSCRRFVPSCNPVSRAPLPRPWPRGRPMCVRLCELVGHPSPVGPAQQEATGLPAPAFLCPAFFLLPRRPLKVRAPSLRGNTLIPLRQEQEVSAPQS